MVAHLAALMVVRKADHLEEMMVERWVAHLVENWAATMAVHLAVLKVGWKAVLTAGQLAANLVEHWAE